jgi:uncharacterized damage-inducible protein DinB
MNAAGFYGDRVTRTDTPSAWDERSTLLTMLQYTRDTAAEKCRNLSESGAAAAPLSTSPLMSVGGVVNHMRWVEHSWIETRFVDGADLGPWTEDSPDQEFIDGAAAPLTDVLRDYVAQAERTDRIIAEHDLEDRSATPLSSGDRPTLRWVVLHLVEENARHNGHLDILRELADGTTGD